MSLSVSGIGAVSSDTTSVYALQSPYLNGVIRTSDAARAAQLDATAQATSASATASAIAANGAATAAATAAPPFANPAITAIGAQIALGQSLTPQSAVTPDALLGSTTDHVLFGDSGTLIQSYGAVALIAGPQAAAVYAPFAEPAVSATTAVSQIDPVAAVS